MKFTIKRGCKSADNFLKMRLVSGRRFAFRFKLDASCLYNTEGIINGWNRVFGVSIPGTTGSCDLIFTKDHDKICLGMNVAYSADRNFKSSIFKRLANICPGAWHLCEIILYKNPSGNWFYNLVIEGENDFFIPVSWQMNAPSGGIPVMMLRHPRLGGRYTLNDDLQIEIETIQL